MDRRSFFMAGAGAAATGLSVASRAAYAAAPATRESPSIFDFGAVGDGVTDDSAAFSKALAVAAAQGHMITVPSFSYAIAKPIAFTSSGNSVRAWGLQCQGATLVSKITSGDDVMSLTSRNVVRYFRLVGGLTIQASGADGNGLRIFAPGGPYGFYNALIEGLSVERAGGHGLLFEGNVFESTVVNSYFQDCKKNGATFAHSKGGICSAISIVGSYFNQNGVYGMAATNLDAPGGGATDIRVYGGYCRDNKSYGFYYGSGMSGGAIEQVGFENNCRSLRPGDASGAHVYGVGSMQLRNCGGYNEHGGATYLLRGWVSGLSMLDGCRQVAGSEMAATGKSRLVQIGRASCRERV